MLGTTCGDGKALKALEEVIKEVAPGWVLRRFKGDLLGTAVLVKDDRQVEVKFARHGKSGRCRLDNIADGDFQERKAIRDQILDSLKAQ